MVSPPLPSPAVTGSEDGMLYFFDVETGSRFNQLSGHLGPVRDVCWAYDESLLASCDTEVRVGLAWPTAGDGAQCMLDNATGYNNHMEKSQEQQQWQAMNLHNSCKYQLHTHTPPLSASLLHRNCIIVICWLLLGLSIHHSLRCQLHLFPANKLFIRAAVTVCSAAKENRD